MEAVEMVDVGDKVRHPKFGAGTVMTRLGGGDNAKVIVKFGGDTGEKKLVLKYAKLKKVNERPTLPAESSEQPAAEGESPAEAEPQG